ncbi:hypothetical protein ABEF92_002368 [Exophiala dermatitidis]|uniref:Isochorismatase-like domain-containing protein n=1 Tax=Exophiala dermatitidis (strain ATCC 34100 / CBS 525.76 / NIH/UT8656) TaxID=858893 RepID=H6BQT0_EXODN|nr:uncharacterized protein HMPREF1120_02786 [Exophiala dermatitidis NIH/UT8656]XP_009155080.1 hypothetical protein, variant [Exophiala dermatitidis NIH/UT8656]EHY54618.1 hypothetical protein, variant [Exophiala dermatitidis NIH/UT8656]EHY54619.1 hypothetical protein HMPREF1120_02786 [Exophiala dermatitidis NIH/UT8656]
MASWTRPMALSSPDDPSSPLSISPDKTAVLLMDYQNFHITNLGDAGASVVKIAAQMRDWALARGMSVFHCLVDTGPEARPPPWSKMAMKWKMHYQDMLTNAAWLGWEAESVAPKGNQGGTAGTGTAPAGGSMSLSADQNQPRELTVLRQPGMLSALESRGLLEILRARGVKSLILCGIATSGCVLSTARAATDQGFIVTVVEDACFDPVPGVHTMVVTHLLPVTAHVATSGEVRDAWMVF